MPKITPVALGFSMIEVLVSLVVLSIALLGIGGLQIVTMKGTQDAHLRTQATIAITDLASKIRINLEGVEAGAYSNPQAVDCKSVSPKSCVNNFCSYTETAHFDIHQAACGNNNNGGIANILPDGKLTITCQDSVCNRKTDHLIKVSWLSQDKKMIYKSVSIPIRP